MRARPFENNAFITQKFLKLISTNVYAQHYLYAAYYYLSDTTIVLKHYYIL